MFLLSVLLCNIGIEMLFHWPSLTLPIFLLSPAISRVAFALSSEKSFTTVFENATVLPNVKATANRNFICYESDDPDFYVAPPHRYQPGGCISCFGRVPRFLARYNKPVHFFSEPSDPRWEPVERPRVQLGLAFRYGYPCELRWSNLPLSSKIYSSS